MHWLAQFTFLLLSSWMWGKGRRGKQAIGKGCRLGKILCKFRLPRGNTWDGDSSVRYLWSSPGKPVRKCESRRGLSEVPSWHLLSAWFHGELCSIDGITESLPFMIRNPDFIPSISQLLAESHLQWRAKSHRCFRVRQGPIDGGICQERGRLEPFAAMLLIVWGWLLWPIKVIWDGHPQPLLQLPRTYGKQSLFLMSFRVGLAQKGRNKS